MTNEETAEWIITFEGLGFALATLAGDRDDIQEARALLKKAIVKALEGKELLKSQKGNK